MSITQYWSQRHNIHLVIFLLSIPLLSTGQDVDLFTVLSGRGNENVTALLPVNGGVLVGGDYTDEILVDENTTTSFGRRDIFLFLFNSLGLPIQTMTFGSADNDDLLFLRSLRNDSIVIAGHYYDEIVFGEDSLVSIIGSKSIFLTILNQDLDVNLVQNIESSRGIELYDLDITAEQSVSVVFKFVNDFVFQHDTISGEGDESLCVLNWNIRNGDWQYDLFHCYGSIGVSKVGYTSSGWTCAGTFNGQLEKGAQSIQTATNDNDIFYYTLNSDHESLSRFGGVLNQSLVELVVDPQDQTWLVGSLEGVMQVGEFSIQSRGFQPNIFLVKTDQDLPLRAWSLGNEDFERVNDAFWQSNQLWLVGHFDNELGIGERMISQGSSDIFALSFDPDGILKQQYQIGDQATEVNPIGAFFNQLLIGYPYSGNSPLIVGSTSQNFDVAIVTVQLSTGVKEFESQKFNVYPNPAETEARVDLDPHLWSQGTITDIRGQVVHTFYRQNFNIDKLNSGIFFVQLQLVNGQNLVSKLVKQ